MYSSPPFPLSPLPLPQFSFPSLDLLPFSSFSFPSLPFGHISSYFSFPFPLALVSFLTFPRSSILATASPRNRRFAHSSSSNCL